MRKKNLNLINFINDLPKNLKKRQSNLIKKNSESFIRNDVLTLTLFVVFSNTYSELMYTLNFNFYMNVAKTKIA